MTSYREAYSLLKIMERLEKTSTEKIFQTKLKGHPNLFVMGEFLYSQNRSKEKNTEDSEDFFLYNEFPLKANHN